MKRRVVDTNVLIVANGRNTNASDSCREATIDGLNAIVQHDRIIIDSAGEMLDEYRVYCFPSGQPGLGDEFMRLVLQNFEGRVERVDLPKTPEGEYQNFPRDPRVEDFDRSDRKFVAASVVADATVINSTDTDWVDHLEPLTQNGIRIEFLCGYDPQSWFA